tara:strand:- start:4480 stop:5193 length:714 start_codon:yes stop_codon:yes gene_type:complete
MKLCLNYGDQKFKLSRDRLNLEAQNLNYFDKTITETEDIRNDQEIIDSLKNPNFEKVFNSKRGGGYWMWKPYIIYKRLQLLNDDDILVYIDSGLSIPNTKYTINKLNEYINVVRNSETGVLAFRNPNIESKWTKGDVFKHFNCLNNEDIYNTRQFSAGRLHVIRKCEYSLNIYKLWWNTAKNYSHLFDDSVSITPNFKNFIENRHDASCWSLICKTNKVEEELNWDSIPIRLTRIRK